MNNLVPDRATYVDGGYQYALQRLTSLYFGLDAEQGSLLFQGMSHDVKILAAAYYCYFISDYYLGNADNLALAASVLIDSLPLIEQYMADADFSGETEMPEWYAYAGAFMQTEEYEQLKTMLPLVASGAEGVRDTISTLRATIKKFAVGMTAKVLGSGVAALTIDETEKATLLETMTSDEVTVPLTEFFVYLLLGSDDGVIAPFNPSNKNIALAVTFLSNAGRYMRVHNNEIILSWLRIEDSYYANEDWHIHQTEIKFDENGHWSECECGYKDEVSVHAFSDWSTIPVKDGDKDVVIRRCPCGYKETKDAPETGTSTGLQEKPIETVTIIWICVGSAVAVAAVVVMVVMSKKKKTAKRK